MIERHIPHPQDRFAACPNCHAQPRHIECHGRTRSESMDFTVPGRRHMLECSCGRHTARHADLRDAEVEWGTVGDQVPMALPMNVSRIRGRKPKAVRS